MIIESDGIIFEKARCVNQELTFDYAQKIFSEKNVGFEQSNKRTLGMINEEGYYTNLALLFSEQCQHSIKCALYDGNTKLEFRDRKEFPGSILKQLDEAYEYIILQNKVESSFQGLNRIEFVSVGGLVSKLTLDDIMLGISESRNENLAGCFYRLKFIESYGTGIQRIYESYLKYGVEPEFKISENAFVVILPNINYKSSEDDNDTKVLKIIKSNEDVTRKEIEVKLGLSKSTINLLLNKLLKEGKIQQEGKGRNIRYSIKK